ncbi:MAG TPA: hypothetical protein VGE01_14625 [Fimbriimonas sp.]
MKHALVLAAALAAFGCTPTESMLVGRWEGDVRLAPPERQAPLSNLANGFAAAISLNVKPDHTFEMTAVLVPVEGTWKAEGRRVTFTPNEVFGYKGNDPANQGPFTLELSPDGRTLQPAVKSDRESRLFFRREAL